MWDIVPTLAREALEVFKLRRAEVDLDTERVILFLLEELQLAT